MSLAVPPSAKRIMPRPTSTHDRAAAHPSTTELLRERAWLQRLARQLVSDEALAQDLVQDTWVSALSRDGERISKPRAWLRAVFFNRLRMHRRKERAVAFQAEEELPSVELDPAKRFERTATFDLLAQRLMELGEPYRGTLIQHYYEGLSSADIARIEGLPQGTVRWRMKKGLDLLRARYGDEDDRRGLWTALAPIALPRTDAARRPLPPATQPASMLRWVLVHPVALLGAAAVSLVVFLIQGDSKEQPLRPVAEALAEVAPNGAKASSPIAGARAGRSALGAATEGEEVPVGALFRVMVEDGDGRPIQGATVWRALEVGWLAVGDTDGNGSIECRAEPVLRRDVLWTSGRVGWRASKKGRAVSAAVFVQPNEREATDVVLVLADREGVLEGRIVDESGQGVQGASIIARPLVLPNLVVVDGRPAVGVDFVGTTTDAEGRFRLGGVLPQVTRLFLHSAFADREVEVDPKSGESLELRLERGPSVR
ncbi:MAG TPA: sigma-70 family RNA polymerase sigma factor, partial [Planctomycetes bacterium]|nr:sigma-70 family RNA polymerase sigma factor [Planctomycetota bacterium]